MGALWPSMGHYRFYNIYTQIQVLLMWWVGFGPKDDEWLSSKVLEDCEALDTWYANRGDGPSQLI